MFTRSEETDPSQGLQQKSTRLVVNVRRRQVELYFSIVETRRALRRFFGDVQNISDIGTFANASTHKLLPGDKLTRVFLF